MSALVLPPLPDIPNANVTPLKGGFRIEGYGGGKGGGSQRTPVETPDSLHSTSRAKILDLVGVGEWEAPVHGWDNILQDIALDGTPVANSDGSLNFPSIAIDVRVGTQDQDYIKGFPASEVTAGVGVELRADTPWTHAISNLELSAVRVSLAVQGLSQANTTNGDINGYRVEYVVELATDGGVYKTIYDTAFDGKTTNTYTRTHRVDLPDATTGWLLRVRRTTADSDSATIQDTTFVSDYTEVIDGKFRYPMAVLVGIQIDAEQFQSIPTRSYNFKRKKIKVPSNYNPGARTYTGTWDGTFKTAYSNNPAWCFYEVLTNELYGTGDIIPAAWIDKWALYVIGQYCDESVPDGKGGTEPRFTCNAYIQSQVAAWKMIQDMASVFRGITYCAGGSVTAVANAPRDPVFTYTAANVIDGKFNYAGSSRTARHTVAMVSWSDQTDQGRAKVEVVEDREGIARYGLRPVEITAFGCTSQGMAQRLGKWLLLTSKLETQAITFQVGLDGTISMPGQIIQVADPVKAGRRIGGRVVSAGEDYIAVDAPVIAAPGDEITITLPSGITERRTISAAIGGALTADMDTYTADTTELTADMTGLRTSITNIFVTEDFSEIPEAETIWALNTEELKTQRFCVVSVTPKDGMIYEIAATQYVEDKFAAIDTNTKIQIPPTTVVPTGTQTAPENIEISSYSVITQGQAVHNAAITWDKAEYAVAYEVEWKRDNSSWIKVPGRSGETRIELENVLAGQYLARVRAVNSIGVSSLWSTSALTEIDGLLSAPPTVVSLTTSSILFGIDIEWTFPASLNIFQRTEIYYSVTNDYGDAIKLGDFAYPQNSTTMMGLASGAEFYFWAVLVDKNGLSGVPYPTGAGVLGSASSDAADILEYLEGQISETQLAEELLETIEGGGDAMVAVEALTNDLAAMYTIKTQLSNEGRTYIAGIGVGVENNEGVVESQVLVAADRFAVIKPNTGSTGDPEITAPFVIQDGQVFINSAFINDLTAEVFKAAWAKVDELTTGIISSEDGRMVSNYNDVTMYMLKEVP